MRICDYSTNDFQSDVRLEEDKFNLLTLFIADRRYVFNQPFPPVLDWQSKPSAWIERQQTVRRMLGEAATVSLEHKLAGQTIMPSSYDHALRVLQKLSREGLRIPGCALEYLKNRIEELDKDLVVHAPLTKCSL